MKKLFGVFTALIMTVLVSTAPAQAQVKVQWFGQACFQLTSPAGAKILIDPFGPDLGYPMPSVSPDAVLVTHEHFDHNYVQMAQGSPKIIHGLDPATQDWNAVDEKIKDVHIYGVGVLHYEKDADSKRGKNMVMVLDMPGMRIVHLGDLGRPLTPEQVKKIGAVDVLMIPVGSVYTIDAAGADGIIKQLNPKLVFPMHYKTAALKIPLDPVDKFIAGKKNVAVIKGNEYLIDKLPKKQQIIVLDYK
jgi:L-ascorbate metabolism protein UlaG (beta-lactamase superfamily)